ncbi:hypothetical protein [Polaribacter sp. Asnod6-C07]|uniref:hypothetical protein n=1 Tax=Polaribacter sp. Asnod6-C07 TaxID=3160582 RepID=UPI00386AE236
MKKKQKTYILLLAVLGIWGTIGYQIYNRMNPSVPELKVLLAQNSFQKIPSVTSSMYELQAEYRDPFLGSFPKKKNILVKNKTKQEQSKKTFPEVIYNGLIQGERKTSYILTINGSQEFLKKGETFQKVKLIKANKEEAVVRFLNETKIILKQ